MSVCMMCHNAADTQAINVLTLWGQADGGLALSMTEWNLFIIHNVMVSSLRAFWPSLSVSLSPSFWMPCPSPSLSLLFASVASCLLSYHESVLYPSLSLSLSLPSSLIQVWFSHLSLCPKSSSLSLHYSHPSPCFPPLLTPSSFTACSWLSLFLSFAISLQHAHPLLHL